MAIKHYLPPAEEYTPPCSGNTFYTDPPNRKAANILARLCRVACECRAECEAEAEATRAVTIGHDLWGVWGGRVYQIDTPKKKKAAA